VNRGSRRWPVFLAVGLVAASVVLYVVLYAIFRDGRDLFFYLLHGLAFLPLEVLIVGLLIERLIALREKRALEHKLNMVIGAFFSELGTPLLSELLPAVTVAPRIKEQLHLHASWKKEDFSRARHFVETLDPEMDLGRIDREALKAHLLEQRGFVLRLLENPNLMEHERFTAYSALVAEWLRYVEHLKADYPYLFSLVVRIHPFQDAPSAVIAE
jgi:hypothetical protein